jgi:hypothetical protein
VIRGIFHPRYTQPIPVIRVDLWLDGFTFTWSPVDFLVDTGSPVTCLSSRDAGRVGIPPFVLADPTRWPRTIRYGGVGGTADYFLAPARYRLVHDDGRFTHIERMISIAPRQPDSLRHPSLLGWDILADFRLNIDWSQRLVELHEPAA